ncbi:arginine utilization regulatory protein [Dethiosulfatibacter aminovorans DSM 17477]|uniref:Arginine utilization regulatory protein n=1 Tax=Dethiosulfatibacter aminovorans DSM 17477 TaxID=1121476 RepID=A0A1M6LXM3_9FIRM|nr:sigma 54-interacting transcriptional regulator [Dethiosulfatibacter aminovorans]SHJ75958.1 arginine utilization regulatory protein [Dethiosulfatibacter aminovorans DSM 17477]
MPNKNKDFYKTVKSIFSLSDDGFALVDKNGDILYSNIIFNQLLSPLNESEKIDIHNCIKNFTLEKTGDVYNANNTELDIKMDTIKISDSTYYIACVKEKRESNVLENMYEAIIQSLTDGIHAADLSGRIRIYNQAQGEIEGYEKEEVLDKKVESLYKFDTESSLLLKVQREKKSIKNIRQTYYTRDGRNIDVVTSVFPLIYNDQLLGSAAIVRDYSKIYELIEKNIEIQKNITENKTQPSKSNRNKKKDRSIHYNFSDIITEDKKLLEDISWAKLYAKNDSNVLIYGETGTGKELFAQSIHSFSERKNNPFLALNCAAIPETLLESLLFGTTKGAFTGAIDKAGLFEQAEGGTIFLDEINSMPTMLQAKLLRVLEEKMVMRLGDNKYIPIDARIISSCNEDPRDLIKINRFRDDLFFRLSVMYLKIPPLKERKNDIGLLCTYFIDMYNEKYNKNIRDVDEEVRKLFYEYDWPGNVRELRYSIEAAMNLATENCRYIELSDIPGHVINNIEANKRSRVKVETNKAEYIFDKEILLKDNDILKKIEMNEYNKIIDCLVEANGNVAEAARIMGISRQKMHYRLKKYNIK